MNKEVQILGETHYFITKSGTIVSYCHGKRKQLKPYINSSGYLMVSLSNRKKLCIHKLLAVHFIPNPENKKQVNHKDGNKLNNTLDNLEWTTPSENMKHAFENGLIVKPPILSTSIITLNRKLIAII